MALAGAVPVVRNLARGEEGFPGNACRIVNERAMARTRRERDVTIG
jgi:hypothetical protein